MTVLIVHVVVCKVQNTHVHFVKSVAHMIFSVVGIVKVSTKSMGLSLRKIYTYTENNSLYGTRYSCC